jgi:tRNA(fMet)-specific endonuclease VapC
MENKPGDIKIASVVKAELLFGVEKSQNVKRNRQKIETFLSHFKVVPFGDNETEIYAKIRAQLEHQGAPIGANDMLIAATVIANEGTLITNNEKEFCKVKGLKVQNWTV